MTFDCHGSNVCENEGQCFEDDPKCPTSSICVCRHCFYGSRCQFSSQGSTLLLDTILGYQIRSNIKMSQQSQPVKVTIALSTTMFILGLINGCLSLLIFQTTKTRDVGCGLYLFASSITSIIILSGLTIKFWFLLVLQMGVIKNPSFHYVQCVSIDFVLRSLLSSTDWLSVCVAIERVVSVFRGISFDKDKSKQVARWMIGIVFLSTILTYIHDPIHRRLIDEEEEQRTWCVTKYSSLLQRVDWIVNIFHFSIPFSINCISPLMIIITAARSCSTVQKNRSYKEHFREQLEHLLMSPFLLAVLALPRLIISFLSECMKSVRDPCFYLIGYFISFIPPMLIFVVFVLPSDMYKNQFHQSIKRFWSK